MSPEPPAQLPLDLAYRPALGRADYLVAPANAEAAAWIDRWPDWPASAGVRTLAITAPPGGGKSHLLSVWRRASGAALAPDAATLDALLAGDGPRPPALAIDDLDALLAAAPAADAALFQLHQRLAERGGALAFTAAAAPARRPLGRPDLASRLAAAPVARIGRPDEGLIAALIVKTLADRGLAAPAELPRYAATRLERRFAAALDFVAALDRRALAAGGRATMATARAALADVGAD